MEIASGFSERLWVNAFSSVLHSDISWGAKGNNKVSKDLRISKTNKRENAVDVAVQMAETDNYVAYEDTIHVLSTKPPEEKMWMQQLHRDTLTAISGHCVRRLTLIHVVTGCFLSYRVVLMAWVLSNVGDWSVLTH